MIERIIESNLIFDKGQQTFAQLTKRGKKWPELMESEMNEETF